MEVHLDATKKIPKTNKKNHPKTKQKSVDDALQIEAQ